MFTVKMSEGVQAASYKKGDKFYIDPYKLLPMDRFLGDGKAGGGVAHMPAVSISARSRRCVMLRTDTCCGHAMLAKGN